MDGGIEASLLFETLENPKDEKVFQAEFWHHSQGSLLIGEYAPYIPSETQGPTLQNSLNKLRDHIKGPCKFPLGLIGFKVEG